MGKYRGFCMKCGSSSSSEWRQVMPEWQAFVNFTNVPQGRRKNVFCAACARSLRRIAPDPMVIEFPPRKQNPAEYYTAPIVSRSPVAGKGTADFFDFVLILFWFLLSSGLKIHWSWIQGLFATRDYEPKEVVTLYLGEEISPDQLETLKDTSYVLNVSAHKLIDGRTGWQGPRGLGRFINSCPVGKKNNVKWGRSFVAPGEDASTAVRMVTTCKITKGQEFFVSYGK